jgi:hypothetical protein
MRKEEAAKIIDAIKDSVAKDPKQFQLTVIVNVTGVHASAYGGGTGVYVSAIGGGPGSRTTGVEVGMGSGDMNVMIARRMEIDGKINREVQTVLDSLNTISTELRAPEPNQSRLEMLSNSLKNTWLPGVITSVVGNLITMVTMK